MFCELIQLIGQDIKSPSVEDLAAVLGMMRAGTIAHFSLVRNSDRDAGFEVDRHDGGFAVRGGEDSLRGSFSFQFHDKTQPAEMIMVDIEELPRTAISSSEVAMAQMAEAWFKSGDLDQRFDWSLNIDTGSQVLYEVLLPAGRLETLNDFLASQRCETRKLQPSQNVPLST